MSVSSQSSGGSDRRLGRRLRRIGLFLGAGVLLCYAGGIAAGYSWLRWGRGVATVRLTEVAFLDIRGVRRAIATQHFTRAREQQTARDFQAAYISYLSGLSNNPDDREGRLAGVEFFRSIGAAGLAFRLLEEGLARAPDDARMIDATFCALLASGRERQALELLRRTYGANPAGPQGSLIKLHELRAVLGAEGAPAARALLDRDPGLTDLPAAAPVVARVLWAEGAKLRAIERLQAYVGGAEAEFLDHVLLANWLMATGQSELAREAAQTAVARFPDQPGARLLLIEARASAAPNGQPEAADVESFLADHAGRNTAVVQLAMLAGRRGWVELMATLYQLGAVTQPDLGLLGLCYADALAHRSRYVDAQRILAELEAQVADETGPQFLQQLRSRQVVVAAARGDNAAVREYARRLAAGLRARPDALETVRRQFQQLGLAEAVAELTPRTPAARPPRPTG